MLLITWIPYRDLHNWWFWCKYVLIFGFLKILIDTYKLVEMNKISFHQVVTKYKQTCKKTRSSTVEGSFHMGDNKKGRRRRKAINLDIASLTPLYGFIPTVHSISNNTSTPKTKKNKTSLNVFICTEEANQQMLGVWGLVVAIPFPYTNTGISIFISPITYSNVYKIHEIKKAFTWVPSSHSHSIKFLNSQN